MKLLLLFRFDVCLRDLIRRPRPRHATRARLVLHGDLTQAYAMLIWFVASNGLLLLLLAPDGIVEVLVFGSDLLCQHHTLGRKAERTKMAEPIQPCLRIRLRRSPVCGSLLVLTKKPSYPLKV